MDKQITVYVESCTMQIKLEPFFSRTPPLVKSKKLLGYVFQEPWRNEEAVTTLDTYHKNKRRQKRLGRLQANGIKTNTSVHNSAMTLPHNKSGPWRRQTAKC